MFCSLCCQFELDASASYTLSAAAFKAAIRSAMLAAVSMPGGYWGWFLVMIYWDC